MLPPVLPVVLAQDGKPWTGSTRLSDLIGIPPEHEALLRPWQPELVFKLIELVRIRYQDLRGTPEGVLTLRALKAEPVNELLSDPVWDPETLEAISPDALERFLRYVYDRDVHRDAFLERMTGFNQFATLKSRLMTLAEQFRAEGREAGHAAGHAVGHAAGQAAGWAKAQRAAILRTLRLRFGSLPESLGAALETEQSQERLEALLDAAVCCSTLEAFVEQLG
jgi:hypothetical protein